MSIQKPKANPHKKQPPLLAVAVDKPGLTAGAVRQGADEILLRLPPDNAGLERFTDEVKFCRLREVRTVLELARPHTDAMLTASAAALRTLYKAGLNAAQVDDLGVLKMVRLEAPALPVIWSPVWNTDGVELARSLGCAQAVLSPFLTREQITGLWAAAAQGDEPIALRVLLYGAGCLASPTAPCYLGKYPGRYGVRCGHACRRPFGYGSKADGLPLALKDISLLNHVQELRRLDTAAFVLDVPLETLEEAALLTRAAAAVLEEPSALEDSVTQLRKVLARPDSTDAFFTGTRGIHTQAAAPEHKQPRLTESLKNEMDNQPERQRVPVRFVFQIAPGHPARLAVDDYQGHTVFVNGPDPAKSREHTLGEAEYTTRLYNTAGTFWLCKEARSRVPDGWGIPAAAFAEMKQAVLDKLAQARMAVPDAPGGKFRPGVRYLPRRDEPAVTVELRHSSQLSDALLALKPGCLYLPLSELSEPSDMLKVLLRPKAKTQPVVMLPLLAAQGGQDELRQRLEAARRLGFTQVLVRHPSQMELAQSLGFALRADFAACNSQTLKELKRLSVLSATLSPGLPLKTVREMSHVMDTELMLYGRIPLLLSEACLIYQNGRFCNCESRNELTDSQAALYPVVRDTGHSSVLYDSAKLWLLPHKARWRRIGLWAARLSFSTENARECVQVTERYLGIGQYEPNTKTTGFFAPEG